MGLGIYVHIPFCKAKCLYCDFNSYSGLERLYQSYTEALCHEIKNSIYTCEVDTLYIGGGTPTVLDVDFLIEILTCIKKKFMCKKDCEITVECNPATMGYEGFCRLIDAGVNRLSIGLQSTKQSELTRLGRIHSLDDFVISFESARSAGFENISLDLMYGLPKQEVSGWMETLNTAISFHPEHISCYALKVEKGTPLFAENPTLPDDDTVRECYDLCVDYLALKGYQQYEISNFSLHGKESRHNCKYWKCEDFLGFGAGAYSCINNHRFDNLKDVSEYSARIKKGESVIAENIPLSIEDRMSEFCFLGLRMNQGISMNNFYRRFQKDIMDVYGDKIEKNLRRGTLLRSNDQLYIPKEWLYVSNSILIDFI